MDSVSVGVQLKNIVYMRTREVMLVIRSWKKILFVKGQTLNTLGFVDRAVSGITNVTVVLETGKENN